MPKIAPITQNDIIINHLKSLKSDSAFSLLLGDYKGFKEAHAKYAELAVDNFETAMSLESPVKGTIPLFSKMGLRIVKCMFLNAFRVKTPKEKLLKKMIKDRKNQDVAKACLRN